MLTICAPIILFSFAIIFIKPSVASSHQDFPNAVIGNTTFWHSSQSCSLSPIQAISGSPYITDGISFLSSVVVLPST